MNTHPATELLNVGLESACAIIRTQHKEILRINEELEELKGGGQRTISMEEIAQAADRYIGHAYEIDEGFEVYMRRDAFKDGARWALNAIGKREKGDEQ